MGIRRPSGLAERLRDRLVARPGRRQYYERGGADVWIGAAPVGSFPANAFGLFDMHGNVQEWVADCWYDSYSDAPTDGSARVWSGCNNRVARGGHFNEGTQEMRSAARAWNGSRVANAHTGLRVARDIE